MYGPPPTQTVRIKVHHRGELVHTPIKWYVNGEVSELEWNWDVDYISYKQLVDLIKSEGYKNIRCLWYWNPKFSFAHGLRSLNNDVDVLNFIKDIKGFDEADVYVEHSVDDPIDLEEIIDLEVGNEIDFDIGMESVDDLDMEMNETEGNEDEFDEGVRVDEDEVHAQVQNDEGVRVDEDDVNVEVQNQEGVRDVAVGAEGQMDGDDSDFVPSGEDSYSDLDLEDSLESYGMDSTIVFLEETFGFEVNQNTNVDGTLPSHTKFGDFDDEGNGNSDQLNTPLGSDDEDEGIEKFPLFKVGDEVRFEVQQQGND